MKEALSETNGVCWMVLARDGSGDWSYRLQPESSQGPDRARANMAPVDQNAPAARNGEPVENASYNQEPTQAPAPPPELPDYSQPARPGDNCLWTPGYWAYSSAGYYWAPGAWIMAPYVGALWTPPWWGYADGSYIWHAGYWGPYVGFYGGINYGFSYTGRGLL
jgi:hypothetical protein